MNAGIPQLGLLAAALLGSQLAIGQEPPATADPSPAPDAPIEHSDDLRSKVTLSAYALRGDLSYDLNLRRRFGSLVGWVGEFVDPGDESQGRIGAEYDQQWGSLLVVPTLQIGTHGLVAGSLYSEWGAKAYLIGGFSRTNLKPFYNLTFDPNESIQLGAGWRLGHFDRVFGFVIFDDRLHTSQQDTHLLWRRRLGSGSGITFDGLYKSGRLDSGRFVRAAGIGLYYDRTRFFAKAYYDPYVNFTPDRMVRLGAGYKF